ncbi:hypothetical protein OROHE_018292 [Orobanche hederae]
MRSQAVDSEERGGEVSANSSRSRIGKKTANSNEYANQVEYIDDELLLTTNTQEEISHRERVLDSGATICSHKSCFEKYVSCDGGWMSMGDDSKRVGNIHIKMDDERVHTLEGVRHVSSLQRSLIYLSKLDSLRYKFTGEGGVVEICRDSNMIIEEFVSSNDLYSRVDPKSGWVMFKSQFCYEQGDCRRKELWNGKDGQQGDSWKWQHNQECFTDVVVKIGVNNKGLRAQACSLALDDRGDIVAKAIVYERIGADDTLHSVPLGEAIVRVCIHSFVQEKRKELLPIPINEDIMTIENALTMFVAWPKKWVIIENENMNICDKNKEVDVQENVNVGLQLESLREMIDEVIADSLYKEEICPMDRDVFECDITFYVTLDEIRDVCMTDKLNCPTIVSYIRYLYEKYETSREEYGFCYPGDVNQFDDPKRNITNKIHHVIEK